MGQLTFKHLLARSSLASPDARAVRAQTPKPVVRRILAEVSATSRRPDAIGGARQHVHSDQGDPPMSSKNNRHVVPNPDGGWDVKAPGAKRVSSHHDRQSDAEHRAKEIVRNLGGGEVRTHGRDGRIRDSDTVAPGNDPNPPRDTKH